MTLKSKKNGSCPMNPRPQTDPTFSNCAQGALLAVFRGTYVVLGIEAGSSICKANVVSPESRSYLIIIAPPCGVVGSVGQLTGPPINLLLSWTPTMFFSIPLVSSHGGLLTCFLPVSSLKHQGGVHMRGPITPNKPSRLYSLV